MACPRTDDRQRATSARPRRSVNWVGKTEVERVLAASEPVDRNLRRALTSASLSADPMCSIWRDPRREDHTICTAVAPDEGPSRSTRTLPAAPSQSCQLVRKFSPRASTSPQVTAIPPSRLMKVGFSPRQQHQSQWSACCGVFKHGLVPRTVVGSQDINDFPGNEEVTGAWAIFVQGFEGFWSIGRQETGSN